MPEWAWARVGVSGRVVELDMLAVVLLNGDLDGIMIRYEVRFRSDAALRVVWGLLSRLSLLFSAFTTMCLLPCFYCSASLNGMMLVHATPVVDANFKMECQTHIKDRHCQSKAPRVRPWTARPCGVAGYALGTCVRWGLWGEVRRDEVYADIGAFRYSTVGGTRKWYSSEALTII